MSSSLSDLLWKNYISNSPLIGPPPPLSSPNNFDIQKVLSKKMNQMTELLGEDLGRED
jgi:hypothetical protein